MSESKTKKVLITGMDSSLRKSVEDKLLEIDKQIEIVEEPSLKYATIGNSPSLSARIAALTHMASDLPLLVHDPKDSPRGLNIERKDKPFLITPRYEFDDYFYDGEKVGNRGGFTKSDLKGFQNRISKRRKKKKNKKTHRRK